MSIMEIKVKKNEYPELFSWKELENLVNIRPLMNSDKVNIIGAGSFSWQNDYWALDKNCYPPSLLRSLMDSHLCYFSNMSRATEKINDLAYSIESEYKSACDAHIYICKNPNIEHPFGIHCDVNHNIIVQCEGISNFKVWNFTIDKSDENRSDLSIKEKPYLDVTMNPGDSIYIPAYVPHLVESKTSRLSVSFAFSYERSNFFQDRTWVRL